MEALFRVVEAAAFLFYKFLAVALIGEIAAIFFWKLPCLKISLAVVFAGSFFWGLGYLLNVLPIFDMNIEGVMLVIGSSAMIFSLTLTNVILAVKSIRKTKKKV